VSCEKSIYSPKNIVKKTEYEGLRGDIRVRTHVFIAFTQLRIICSLHIRTCVSRPIYETYLHTLCPSILCIIRPTHAYIHTHAYITTYRPTILHTCTYKNRTYLQWSNCQNGGGGSSFFVGGGLREEVGVSTFFWRRWVEKEVGGRIFSSIIEERGKWHNKLSVWFKSFIINLFKRTSHCLPQQCLIIISHA